MSPVSVWVDSYGAQLHPLPSDPEGVVVDSLLAEGNPKNDKVLFIWSSCNPPTNVSLSKGRRDKILSVCKTHNIPVIDNCMLELYNLEKDGPNYLFRQGFSDGVVQIGAFPRGMAAGTWLSCHPLRPAQGEGHRAMAAHRVAQQMDFIDPQLIDHAFQNAGVEIRTRAAVDDSIAFAPPRTVEEQHAIARLDQRVNIAAEVKAC